MNNKWVRSISFNKTNEKDVARLKLIGKKSFSRYVKKLLDEELKRQKVVPSDTAKTDTPPQKRTPKAPSIPVKPTKRQVFNPMLRK